MSLRDELLEASDLPTEVVHLEDKGKSVTVRGLTGHGGLEYGRAIRGMKDPADSNALLIARCMIDDDGERVLNDDDRIDKTLTSRDYRALLDAVIRINGFDGDEVEGNSEPSPSD